jgi:aryl-alcohol dehydrogenase-like predicted oxidoreductase
MSARRLGLDHIDLYYLHTPTMTDAPFEEIVDTLARMRQDGLILHLGLSNVSAETRWTPSLACARGKLRLIRTPAPTLATHGSGRR